MSLAISWTVIHLVFTNPEYKASTILAIKLEKATPIKRLIDSGIESDPISSKCQALVEIFESPDVHALVIEKVRRFAPRGRASDIPSLVSGGLSHYCDQARSIFTISGNSPDPQFTAAIANAAADIVMIKNNEMNLRELSEIETFLKNQERELRGRLTLLENEVATIQTRAQIVSPEDMQQSVSRSIDRVQNQLVDANVALETNRKLTARTERELKTFQERWIRGGFNAEKLAFYQAQHRLSMLQYRETIMKDSSADVRLEINHLMGAIRRGSKDRFDASVGMAANPVEYLRQLEESLAVLRKDGERFAADAETLKTAAAVQTDNLPKITLEL
ncbi:MAG: hypothetical protein ABL958_01715, partial [Bdellovibrionia bacterium]